MKLLKNLSFALILTVFAFKANAQTDKTTTAKIVADKNYVFVATAALPMNATDINNVISKMPGNIGAGTINLNGSNYDLKIVGDSIIAYLPYYGRSFSAPINRDDSGIKFTSTDFTYKAEKRKKGGWQIDINIKDAKESPRLNLNITENGYGSLIVTTNSKQSITYNGYIAEVSKKQ